MYGHFAESCVPDNATFETMLEAFWSRPLSLGLRRKRLQSLDTPVAEYIDS
jgi:hypothetical protein